MAPQTATGRGGGGVKKKGGKRGGRPAFGGPRLSHFNPHCFFKHGSISVRNQSSRWGSCSRRGTLSFNYRLLFLPPHLADYVIVHDLCHQHEMNHSKRFWEIVAQAIHDYLERRKQLRKLEDTLLIH